MIVTMDAFIERYAVELARATEQYPEDYGYTVEQVPLALERVPAVVARMRAAFVAGSFNKDGRAIKATCKAFGIKHTYTAMRESVEGLR